MRLNINNYYTSRISTFLFISACGFLGVLEFLAYWKKGLWSVSAAYIWIACGLFFLFASAFQFGKALRRDIEIKFIWGIFFLIFFSLLVLFYPYISEFINHESTQQASSALLNIKEKDFHYTGKSFLGYPSRQYLITTLPSFFFGRTPLSLNLGYAVPFIVSLYVFYSGLRTFFKNDRNSAILSTIGIISIFMFTYVFRTIFLFEQSILPLTITLCAGGWFLIVVKKPSKCHFFALLWIGSFLSGIYSPGFASWLLLICAEIYQFIVLIKSKKNSLANTWLSIGIVTIIFGALSIWSVNNANPILTGLNNPDLEHESIIAKSFVVLKEGFSIFFSISQNGKNFVHALLYFPIIIYLSSSLILKNGIRHLFLAVWILLTIGAAVILKGYASPPPDFSLHRALVIIPPLMIGMLIWIKSQHFEISRSFLSIFISLSFAVISWSYIQTVSSNISGQNDLRSKITLQVLKLEKQGDINMNKQIHININNNDSSLDSLNDMIQYFIPVYSINVVQDCSQYNLAQKNAILFTDSVSCVENFRSKGQKFMPLLDEETQLYFVVSKNI